MECTLVIIKPDAVLKGLVLDVKTRYILQEMKLQRSVTRVLDLHTASLLYAEHRGQFFFEGLVLAMVSGPCHVMVLSGRNVICRVREMNGPTRDAPSGTIRGDFPSAGGPFNMVHGSDSPEAVLREIGILFPKLCTDE